MMNTIMGYSPLCNGKLHTINFLPKWDTSQYMGVLSKKIEKLMEAEGLNYKSLSLKAKLGETAVRDIVVGRVRSPRMETIQKIAYALGVSSTEIISGSDEGKVSVIGYVGAGIVYAFDDAPKGEVEEDSVICPVGLEFRDTVAVKVRGESMRPALRDGWLLFYSKHQDGVPQECLNQLCVVCVQENGMMVRDIKSGSKPGLFHLIAYNGETQFDVKVKWASKILDIRPN